ncbi:MAG: sensor histidine kinase [Chitinophagaceae bacterium]|nr:sensor histidine kinase [Chitinophagaceae bacterium]
MKKILAGLYCLLSVSLAQAQPVPDSLRKIINESEKYPVKINAWIELLSWYELKSFDTTIDEGNRAMELARAFDDSLHIAMVRHHMGIAFYFKGEYDEAARQYFAAAAILEKKPDAKKELAHVYNEMAKLFRKTRDLNQAMIHYDKADALFRELKDSIGLSMILNESGVVYEYRGEYKEALRRYVSSLHLAEARGDSLGVSYSVSNIAGVYVLQQQFDEAEAYLLRALRIRQILKDPFAIALTYTDLGASMNAKGDYAKAIRYLTLSNEMAEKMNYPELQSNNYNELASAAEKQGDFEAALNFYRKKTSLSDSLFSIEKTRQISELNARYDNTRKEQQIQQQKARIRLQNFIFVGIAGLVLLAVLLLQSLYRKNKLREETRVKTILLKQQEDAVKSVLDAEEKERQRIAKDLHDGVGQLMSAAKMNLSAFESEITFTDPEQAEDFSKIIGLVDESCREVRNVSHVMMPNALQKNDLGMAVREFVDKLHHKNLAVHVYTEGLENRMDSTTETLMYRVIQECVNNVIKHAGATNLDISLVRDPLTFSGTIEDNGHGFEVTDDVKNNGIGLSNIKSRIEYLRGSLDLQSSPGRGTLVAFHIPLTPKPAKTES